MKSPKRIAMTLAAVIACGAATDAFAGDGKRRGGRARAGERFGKAMRERRQRAVKFLAALDVTDEQRRVVLEKARIAAPVVETAKDEARRIVAAAWASAAKDPATSDATAKKALRESAKTQLAALRERTRASIEPLAKEVVASLTPEQRKKFEEAAAKRGRTLDEAKLVKFASRLIRRPMTVPYLEARIGR